MSVPESMSVPVPVPVSVWVSVLPAFPQLNSRPACFCSCTFGKIEGPACTRPHAHALERAHTRAQECKGRETEEGQVASLRCSPFKVCSSPFLARARTYTHAHPPKNDSLYPHPSHTLSSSSLSLLEHMWDFFPALATCGRRLACLCPRNHDRHICEWVSVSVCYRNRLEVSVCYRNRLEQIIKAWQAAKSHKRRLRHLLTCVLHECVRARARARALSRSRSLSHTLFLSLSYVLRMTNVNARARDSLPTSPPSRSPPRPLPISL